MNWYRLKINDILEKLGTSENGLNNNEVVERLKKFGPNKLADEEEIIRFKILLHQFKNPLIYILLIAGVVTIL